MWYSLSVTCDWSVVFSGSSGFLHQLKWPPGYNWNIELKHHQGNKQTLTSHNFVLIFIFATFAYNGVHLKSHIMVKKQTLWRNVLEVILKIHGIIITKKTLKTRTEISHNNISFDYFWLFQYRPSRIKQKISERLSNISFSKDSETGDRVQFA
jgi:hypothetical protein